MQYAYTSESGSRVISDHGSDALNSQSDEAQFKPRYYTNITIEEFIYESWPPSWRYGSGATYEFYDSPITSIVCQGGICVYSYEAGNESETVQQHGASTLLFLGPRRISSFQTVKGKRTGLFRFTSAEESRTWVYYPGLDLVYTEIDWGSITANAGTTSDHGLVTKLTATPVDYGRIIYVTTQEAFGFKKVIGEAQARATNAWVGEGRLVSFGRQTSPAIYGWITDGKVRLSGTADVDFSPALSGRGILPLRGDATIGIAAGITGSGSLKKFLGSAESITYNPDERQLLFSFTGEHSISKSDAYYGSGVLKNFASVEADKVFAYEGSGFIRLLPRKPVTYELGELANYTLEIDPVNQNNFGDNTYRWHGSTKLGAVQLNELTEWSHEKHTEVYDQGPVVPFIEKDWGLVSGCNNIETISTSGDITGVSTGCIVRVDTGVTARVTSNQSYQVAPSNNQASNFIDYGDITSSASQHQDWGHILTTTDLIPGGLFRFDQSDTAGASIQRVPSWVGSGTIRLGGVTVLPVDVSIHGDGNLFAMGGAGVTSTNAKFGEGLFKIGGSSVIGICADLIGDGTFSTFSGSAESVAWNPDEKQLLFSILGGAIEKHAENYLGSGNIKSLSGGIERSSYDYVGSGSIVTFNKLEEARTYFYNCSSIVEFGVFDYGLLVDPTNTPITTLNTQTISTNTTAPTGVVRVASGNVVGISTGVTYTVPSTQTIPSTYLDYGFVSQYASATNDYGWILGTVTHGMPACIYGTIDISGACADVFLPVWNGRGTIRTSGESTQLITRHYHGSGSIKTVSGAAETAGRAEEGGGLFRITDSATIGITATIKGDGRLPTISGAAESITWNPDEKQMLFDFLGEGSYTHTENYLGSGNIKSLSGGTESGSFDWVGSGTIRVISRKPDCYELGELANFTLDNYVVPNEYLNLGNIEFYTGYTNLAPVQLKWIVCEESHEKHTEAYNNSACFDEPELDYGYLVNTNLLNCVSTSGVINTDTTATSGCIKVDPGTTFAIAPTNTYTIPNQLTVPTSSEDYGSVSNVASPWRDYGHILDTLGKVCPFGAFEITGTAKTHFVENIVSTGYSVSGKAGVTIFGSGETFWTPPYHTEGLFIIDGIGAEAFARTPYIGSGSLKKFSGAAESVTWNPEEKQLLFSFTGAVYPLFSLLHPGSGTIRVTGEGEEPRARVHIGSGTFKKFSGAAESITWNPEERQMLFSFIGERIAESKSITETGSGIIRIPRGTAAPYFFIPRYPGSGTVRVTGEATTHYVPDVVGTGTFKKFSGASESVTYNPEERQLLFSFIGEGSESRTLTTIGSGRLYAISGAAETVGYADEGTGLWLFRGDGLTSRTGREIGSGSLKKFSGAAESVTYNPEERQLLFSFTGQGTETFTANPPEEGSLSRILGTAATFFIPKYVGSGTIRISGQAGIISTNAYVGFGSLRKISGAAESVTYNPEEKQLLFSFAGGITSEKHTESYVGQDTPTRIRGTAITDYQPSWTGSGTVRLRGDAGIKWVPNNVGEGTLYTISGASESVTYNPDEKQLLFSILGQVSDSFTINAISEGGTLRLGDLGDTRFVPHWNGEGTVRVSGIGKTHWVPSIVGSGGLWTWSGAADSYAVAITSIPTLFRVYGDGHVSRTRPYTGSGSLRKLSGSAESVTYNPDERQMLFSFIGQGSFTRTRSESGQGTIRVSGESTVRFSPVYFGSGTARVSGEATTTRARDFVGFGTLRKISGAAESITWNPEEKQMLFSFMGEGSKARTSRELSQGGVLTVRGTSGDPLLTFAEQPEVQIAISGDSYDLRTHAYAGSGTISNVNNLDEAFAPTTYIGSGEVLRLRGTALVQVVVWQPPHSQVWII